MRAIVALLLLCACAQGARDQGGQEGSTNEPDASVATDAGISVGEAADAGLPGNADGGEAATIDAGQTSADAGASDRIFAFSQFVDNDGGPITLTVTPEPGSSCASWLPQATVPESKLVQAQEAHGWPGVTTDGIGDLGFNFSDIFFSTVGFAKDGTLSEQAGIGSSIDARGHTFLFDQVGGNCLICEATLLGWPTRNHVALGNGYPFSKNCTYAGLQGGDVLLSCVGPDDEGNPATFDRYDENLTFLSSQPGDGQFFIGADLKDRILEGSHGSNQWRWVDSNGTPLTGFFAGTGNDPSVQRLIGGGLIDSSRSVIPSGSASVSAAPQWLAEWSSVSIVLGGRAYALGDKHCGLEITDADGAICGRLDFENCRTAPRPGVDGSIVLPTAPNGYFTEQTLAVWPNLLR